jgi:hypothetical protein
MPTAHHHSRVDMFALVCLALIAIGWFAMNTLVASFGRYTQHTAFYQMGVIMFHPAALFVGIGSGHAFALTAFTILSIVTLGAVFAPLVSAQRNAWLTGWMPLALMLGAFALVYSGGSSAQLDAATSSGSLHDDVWRLANHLIERTQNTLATHIKLGAGGVLSLGASFALAIRSLMNYLGAAVVRTTAATASVLRA